MQNQIPIMSPEEIKFGKAMAPSDLETGLIIHVYTFKDTGTIKSGGTHSLVEMITEINTVIGKIQAGLVAADLYDSNTIDYAGVYFNLGRIARMALDGEDIAYRAGEIESELSKSPAGAVMSTKTKAAKYCALWFIYGGDFKELFGEWNPTQWKWEDYIWAGIFCVLFYVCRWWNLHLSTYKDLIMRLGKYSKLGDSNVGEFRPFDPNDPSTWFSLLVEQENTDGNDYFGLKVEDVDDATYRGITVCWLEGSEQLANRLLSKSHWEWRFGRFVEIKPVYFLSPASEDDDGDCWDDLEDGSAHTVRLFRSTYTDCNYLFFNRHLNECVSNIKKYWFKNKSYAALKEKFKFMPFMNVPAPAETGSGGLLAHQCTYYKCNALAYTNIKLKFPIDDGWMDAVKLHRESGGNYKYEIIGDVPLDDVRLLYGLATKKIGATPTDLSSKFKIPIESRGGITIQIGRTEDREYYADRAIVDNIVSTGNSSLVASELSYWEWVKNTTNAGSDYGFGGLVNKQAVYRQRAFDPYKKIPHVTYDINNFDIDLVADTLRKAIFGLGGVKSDIKVSAMPELDKKAEDKSNLEAEGTKKPDIEVSAAAPAKIQQDIVKEQKKITELKKDLAESKKEEAKK